MTDEQFDTYWAICEKESHLRYPYYYDEPCAIGPKSQSRFKRIQHLLYKSFKYFLPRYRNYEHIITYSEKTRQIADHFDLANVRIGFYRPDFVVNQQGGIQICELGARYYEAYWGHGIPEYIMEKRSQCRNDLNGKRITRVVIEEAERWWGGLEQLTILKGRDREGDIRFYRPYFEKIGVPIQYIYPDTIADNLHLLKDGPVLSSFSQMELEALTSTEIEAVASSNCLNPLSTVMLLHDKRFLAVLWDDEFRSESLTPEESDFLKPFLIPTYTRNQYPEIWEEARLNKDGYILKPQLLGKSEGIVPGPLVDEAIWARAFENDQIKDMVLQPWIQQKIFNGTIDGKSFQDYTTGMMLCIEDEFNGLGQFRMTSAPVANFIPDDRKMAPWMTNAPEMYANRFFEL